MTRVVVGAADQALALEVRAALDEMEGVEVAIVAESSAELVTAVLRADPDVVLVHDLLGPEPAVQTVREITLRRPTCAAVLVTGSPTTDVMAAAMDAGARGAVDYPLTFEQLQARVQSAADWSAQMRRLLSATGPSTEGAGSRGRAKVVVLAGGKGGVGTTTLTVHMALDVCRSVPDLRVCLVDLDLEKGDVIGALELRHRVSIADVAKVSDDLSARTIGDAVVAHASGLHLLLPPQDVRDIEAITPLALRQIFALLRQDYDLVLVDAGSHVTPVQAAVVEIADEVVTVVTPDVLALRGLRRTINAWETLAVRKEQDVRVLVNRVSKQATVSFDAVRRLTRAPVLPVGIPAMFLRLEPAINARDPLQVRESVWWKGLRTVGAEIGLVDHFGTDRAPLNGRGTHDAGRPSRRGSARRPRRSRDEGSVTVETVGVLPAVLLIAVLVWQCVLFGLAFVWVGHAGNAAARALGLGNDPAVAAREALPSSVADDVRVSAGGRTVVVRLDVPLVAPGVARLPVTVSSQKGVVVEP